MVGIRELTRQSSELILFNTAISKVLVSQQNILHSQQDLLQKQASEIENQNRKIEENQVSISDAQKRIDEAHAGLLKAIGISDQQAIKLIDCAERLESAEQKMELSNQELERSVVTRIVACEGRAESIKAEVDEALYNYRQEAAIRLEALSTECNSAIEGLRSQLSNFELKINAESEARKLAVTSVAQEFNRQIDELRSEQAVGNKKLLSELESAQDLSASQITALASSFDKRELDAAEKHKKLLYSSISALIVSVLSLATSVYVSLGA